MRQKSLARLLVENLGSAEPLNKKEMLLKVGYAENTAIAKQKEILELEGVREELEILGFDEASAKKVVSNILHNDDEKSADRLRAAEMVFKVHGTFAPEVIREDRGNTYNFLFASDTQKEIKNFEEKLKEKLLSNATSENKDDVDAE